MTQTTVVAFKEMAVAVTVATPITCREWYWKLFEKMLKKAVEVVESLQMLQVVTQAEPENASPSLNREL